MQVQVTVETNVPTLVLIPDREVQFGVGPDDTQFRVTTVPLTDNYDLNVSLDGSIWYKTPYTFGPTSKWKTGVGFGSFGMSSIHFKLVKS